MSRRGEREATPVVLVLEGFGGVYSACNSALHLKVWRAGELVKPERGMYLLEHPDTPGVGELAGAERVRELARGRATTVGNTYITELTRTVYDHLWRRIPADQRAPVEGDFFKQTYGPAVRINGRDHLITTLWNRAWSPTGLPEPGHSSGDDDDDYEPPRPQHRGRIRRRPATAPVPKAYSAPSTRGRMGASGSRGRMGRG